MGNRKKKRKKKRLESKREKVPEWAKGVKVWPDSTPPIGENCRCVALPKGVRAEKDSAGNQLVMYDLDEMDEGERKTSKASMVRGMSISQDETPSWDDPFSDILGDLDKATESLKASYSHPTQPHLAMYHHQQDRTLETGSGNLNIKELELETLGDKDFPKNPSVGDRHVPRGSNDLYMYVGPEYGWQLSGPHPGDSDGS
jgi:hypothetical protein